MLVSTTLPNRISVVRELKDKNIYLQSNKPVNFQTYHFLFLSLKPSEKTVICAPCTTLYMVPIIM